MVPQALPVKNDTILRLFRERDPKRPLRILAPMVDQSELPFRMLTRRFGADLCYTPMIHARMTLESVGYLDKNFSTSPDDRPVVAQFCGNDPAILLAAAKRVQDRVDAIDLNMGCPQGIAKRGAYGAFLLPVEPETEAAKTALLVRIVSTLHAGLTVPVTCKIRVLGSFEATLRLVLALQGAGCAVLTIHGRQRSCIKERVGPTDWETIARVKAHPSVTVPIIANGGLGSYEDIETCGAAAGVDGVMTSEGVLENPGLMSNRVRTDPGHEGEVCDSFDMALQYIELARAYPGADTGCVRAHLIKMLFGPLRTFTDLRSALVSVKGGLDAFRDIVLQLQARYRAVVVPLPWPLPEPSPDLELSALGSDEAAAAAAEAALTAQLQAMPGMRPEHAPSLPTLARLILAWHCIRRAHPAAGLCHPAYLWDMGIPGLWYMRYRKEVYGVAKPDKAAQQPAKTTKQLLEEGGQLQSAPAVDATPVPLDASLAMVQSDGCALPGCGVDDAGTYSGAAAAPIATTSTSALPPPVAEVPMTAPPLPVVTMTLPQLVRAYREAMEREAALPPPGTKPKKEPSQAPRKGAAQPPLPTNGIAAAGDTAAPATQPIAGPLPTLAVPAATCAPSAVGTEDMPLASPDAKRARLSDGAE